MTELTPSTNIPDSSEISTYESDVPLTPSSRTKAHAFIEALECLEKNSDFEKMTNLFRDDAHLTRNLFSPEDAETFWKHYLEPFVTIRSKFISVIENKTEVGLEWRSEGKLKSGKSICYGGSSYLCFDGDKIRRFATYFDSAPFVEAVMN